VNGILLAGLLQRERANLLLMVVSARGASAEYASGVSPSAGSAAARAMMPDRFVSFR
jgi:hypothetical protein